MYIKRIGFILIVLMALVVFSLPLGMGAILAAPSNDPIPAYINQINSTNLFNVASDLVTLYSPRRVDSYSPYIDDQCTIGTTVYPKNTIEMSSDYVKGLFEAMGYSSTSITMEEVPGGAGHNVYVTKVGSTYPNIYIEYGAHLDTVNGSPGGNDNTSGVTAVIELARVLKDYPNRYSMRFALWVAEEYSAQYGEYYGSSYHVQQALARGEQIKAGLNFESVGWPDPADPTGLMNEISYNDAESERIAGLFNQVRSDYGIAIGFRENQGIIASDQYSYWNQGKVAVASMGGWLTYRPNYHGCGDTVSNINFTNVLRTAQENLAVGLKLDAEILGATSTPTLTPTPTPSGAITIGESNILANDDSGNGNLLVVQQGILSKSATLQSLSFYVASPAGRLRLGIYSDAGGAPQTLMAQTAEFSPVVGWNTQNVVSPIYLTAGTYWLAYLPESNSLHFRSTSNGSARWYSLPYGAMPATFSTSPQSGVFHWSFYATLLTGGTPVATLTPTQTATFTPTPTASPTNPLIPTGTPTATATGNPPTPTNTATSTPTLTPTPTPSSAITIGESNILTNDDSGNGNLLVAQQGVLSQSATLQSLSFYVASPAGRLRLGIYSDAGGAPQTLMAQTAEFSPVVGWNTQNVVSPIYLTAGTYWLAYLPESNSLHFRSTSNGSARWYSLPYGAMPATFSTSPQSGVFHWSFYATLLTGGTPVATLTPTQTSTFTLTPTMLPDMIFADGFESGNLSAWSSSTTGGGDLSVSIAAALKGSYGMQAVINDNTSIYVTDENPSAELRYRARFYFDLNSITMASGNAHYIFYGYSGASTVVMRVEFRNYSGNYQLRAALVNDLSTWTTSSWFTISDATHFIELDWKAATAAGANNGYLTFWIDGVQQANLNGIDNDTRKIDRAQLGAVSGIDSGTRGTYYFDAFESRRQTYIGP